MSNIPGLDGPVAAVVILAAGEGKRMRSTRSKLLHEIAGHSMLSYAVTAATNVRPEHIVVVVGHGRDQVEAHLGEIAPHVITAVQDEQRGTGHAVQVALSALTELSGEVIVTLGDVPLDRLPLHTLRHRILVSEAEPRLFTGTLRDELDPWARAVDDDDVLEALRVAAADDVLEALPDIERRLTMAR